MVGQLTRLGMGFGSAAQQTGEGYSLEAAIPWQDIRPRFGKRAWWSGLRSM